MAASAIIHVNQHVIRANRKAGKNDPPLTIKAGGAIHYAHDCDLMDAAGNRIGRLIYRPDDPLDCGATLWLEMEGGSIRPIIHPGHCPLPPGKATRLKSPPSTP